MMSVDKVMSDLKEICRGIDRPSMNAEQELAYKDLKRLVNLLHRAGYLRECGYFRIEINCHTLGRELYNIAERLKK